MMQKQSVKKLCVILLVLFLFCSSFIVLYRLSVTKAQSSITVVQAPVRGYTSGTTLTIVMPSVPLNTDVLVLTFSSYSTLYTTVSSIANVGGGVSWSLVVQEEMGLYDSEIWEGIVTTNLTVSGNQVVLTLSANSNGAVADVAEYSGVSLSGVDQTGVNESGPFTQSTSASVATNYATSVSNELVVAGIQADYNQTHTASDGYTMADGVAYNLASNAYLYQIISSSGIQSTTTTISHTSYWTACIATFEVYTYIQPTSYSILPSSDTYSTITPSTLTNVTAGANQTFTFSFSPSYTMYNLTVDGSLVWTQVNNAITNYTFTNVTANHVIAVTSAPITYINATAGTGAFISPSGDFAVNYGSNIDFTYGASAGYNLANVTVNGNLLNLTDYPSSYYFPDVTTNQTITVLAQVINNTALAFATGGNCTITDITQSTHASGATPTLPFNYGDQVTFTLVTPSAGATFSYWQDGNGIQYTTQTVTFTLYATFSMTAHFNLNQYTITSSNDSHTTINPYGTIAVNYGNSQTFTMTASSGYIVGSVLVDGVNQGAITTYTFTSITSSHTIQVISITSPQTNYKYTITGPYYDSGAIASATENVTMDWVNGTVYNFNLVGTGSTVQSLTVNSISPISQMTWNDSSALNYTRSITFIPQPSTVINLYITNNNSPASIYVFSVTDFAGMTNAYLQTSVSSTGLAGSTNMVEQASLSNNINPPTFIMQQYQTYTLNFICDQGTYSIQFTAESTLTNSLLVPAGAFPTANITTPTVDVERINATAIAIIYQDPSYTTNWLYITITHQTGTLTVNDYTSNTTGYAQSILWTNADSQTSYTILVTASITSTNTGYGNLPTWEFSVSTTVPANPWLGAFDWLGQYVRTMPYTPTGWANASGGQWTSGDIAEVIGMAIILLFLGVGSFRSSGAACITAWIASGILIYLGWWGNGTLGAIGAIPSFALCGFVAIFIQLSEGKDTIRET